MSRPQTSRTSRAILARPRVALGLCAGLGLGLSTALLAMALRADERRAEARFHATAREHLDRVGERFDAKLELVASLARFFASSHAVEPDEFERFTSSIFTSHRGVVSLAWAQRVGPDPVPGQLYTPDTRFEVIHETRRAGTPSSLGLDVLADGPTQRAIRDSHGAVGHPVLFLPDEQPAGDELFAHILVGVSRTTATVWPAPIGFVVAAIALEELLPSIRAPLPPGMAFRVQAFEPFSRVPAIVAEAGVLRGPHRLVSHRSMPGSGSGRLWMLACLADEDWFAVRRSSQPWLFFLLGLAVTAMVSLRVRAEMASLARLARETEARGESLAREIEAARQAAVAQQAATLAAEETAEVRTRFLANVSHELRTPLNGVLGALDMALLDHRLDSEPRRHLEQAQRASQSLTTLVDNMLVLTEGVATSDAGACQAFDVRALVRAVAEHAQRDAQARNLQLCVELPATAPPLLSGDVRAIEQILRNLVDNALKFTEQGSVGLAVAVQADAAGHARVAFSVADNGPGIPPEAVSRIFQPFFQADESLTRRHGGLGIGLAASLLLAQRMGGTLRCHAPPGAGSIFELALTLPLHMPAAPPVDALACHDEQPSILVVEDNDVNRTVLKAMLTKLGCRVASVSNGEAALARIHAGPPVDLILMDCQMPVLDGYAATRRLREMEGNARRTPVVAVTAHAGAHDRQQCLAAGMDDYLIKPLGLDALRVALQRWCGTAAISSGT